MGKILGKTEMTGWTPQGGCPVPLANFLRLVDGQPLIFTPSLALETPLFTSFSTGSHF